MKTLLKITNIKGITLFPLFYFIILFLLMINSSYAQSNFATMPSSNISGAINKSSDKLIKSFGRSFKDAKNPAWIEAGKNYLVKFTMDDMKYRALYNKNGRRIYLIAYGNQNNLSAHVKAQIKDDYPGYTINSAVNVKQNGRSVWVINLEGATTFVTLRMEYDDLKEFETVKKFP